MSRVNYDKPILVTNEAPTEGVDFVLQKGIEVSGTVVDARTGDPVTYCTVTTVALDVLVGIESGAFGMEEFPPRFWLCQTDENGKFRLPHVAPGKYVLSATHAQHVPGESAEVVVEEEKPVTGVRIELQPGDQKAWLEEREKELRAKAER